MRFAEGLNVKLSSQHVNGIHGSSTTRARRSGSPGPRSATGGTVASLPTRLFRDSRADGREAPKGRLWTTVADPPRTRAAPHDHRFLVGMHPDIQIGAFVITGRSPVWCGLSTAAEAGPSMIPSTREKKGMDLSAIWNAITQNLATVSLVSVGGRFGQRSSGVTTGSTRSIASGGCAATQLM